MWTIYGRQLAEKTGLKCPVSGQELFDYGGDIDTLDGPTTYKTLDGRYVYEKWPRDYGFRLYPKATFDSPMEAYPNKYITGVVYVKAENGWVGYYQVKGHEVSFLDPYLDTRCNLFYAQYVAEGRLREIEYEKYKRQAGHEFGGIMFPIVRRVFGNIVGNDLVSVQSLSMPAGQLFYMDYKYKGKSWNKKYGVPDWLWTVSDRTDLTYDGGPLAQRGVTTRKYKLFGVTIWKKKSAFMS